jgi:hypothetical protein
MSSILSILLKLEKVIVILTAVLFQFTKINIYSQQPRFFEIFEKTRNKFWMSEEESFESLKLNLLGVVESLNLHETNSLELGHYLATKKQDIVQIFDNYLEAICDYNDNNQLLNVTITDNENETYEKTFVVNNFDAPVNTFKPTGFENSTEKLIENKKRSIENVIYEGNRSNNGNSAVFDNIDNSTFSSCKQEGKISFDSNKIFNNFKHAVKWTKEMVSNLILLLFCLSYL